MATKTNSSLNKSIASGLSTSIVVKVGNTTVGAIQSITINQNRNIEMFQEVGTEGFVDSCPKGAAAITLDITRMVFDNLRITESFARGFVNIQAQRIPFNIEIIDTAGSTDERFFTVSTIYNCWFNYASTPYSAHSYLISETVRINAEKIVTNRGGFSTVSGGDRGISFDFDTIERDTDVNGGRGKLDSSGDVKR
jgi:hypothetical protein